MNNIDTYRKICANEYISRMHRLLSPAARERKKTVILQHVLEEKVLKFSVRNDILLISDISAFCEQLSAQ